jgi:hypothetical protein
MKIIAKYLAAILVVAISVLFLSKFQITIFERGNKDLIRGQWKNLLENKLMQANTLSIFRNIDQELVFSSSESEVIDSFLDCVEIDEAKSGSYCFCGGELRFVFTNNTNELVSLSYHHKTHFRWADGYWPGDAYLTASSKRCVEKWLETRNISDGYQEKFPSKEEITKSTETTMNLWDMLELSGNWGIFVFPISSCMVLGTIIGWIFCPRKAQFYAWVLSSCISLNTIASVMIIWTEFFGGFPRNSIPPVEDIFHGISQIYYSIWLLTSVLTHK